MRRWIALATVCMLALTVAFAAVGCGGQKTEETSTSTETPMDQTTMPADTAMPDTMGGGMDTTMQH